MPRHTFAILTILLLGPLAWANPPAPDTQRLAASLRSYLLPQIPNPLYEKWDNWGQKADAFNKIHWEGHGLNTHPTIQKVPRNHGVWKHVKITAPNLTQSLVLTIANVRQPEPGRTTFDVHLDLPANIEYDQENWEKGIRLWQGTVRARLHLSLNLGCEVVTRVDSSKLLSPAVVFRARIVQSRTSYDSLVIEHLPGIGGDTARILGDAIHKGIQQWHPSLERNLINRLDAAIVKSGDTKEIRIGFSGLSRK